MLSPKLAKIKAEKKIIFWYADIYKLAVQKRRSGMFNSVLYEKYM